MFRNTILYNIDGKVGNTGPTFIFFFLYEKILDQLEV